MVHLLLIQHICSIKDIEFKKKTDNAKKNMCEIAFEYCCDNDMWVYNLQGH